MTNMSYVIVKESEIEYIWKMAIGCLNITIYIYIYI